MREQVIKSIEENKIIVIVRGLERENLIPFAEAVYSGGMRLMELTYSADGSVSDEEIADRIKMLSEHFKGRMFIGAGTVLNEKQIELTKKSRRSFHYFSRYIRKCHKENKRAWLGVYSRSVYPFRNTGGTQIRCRFCEGFSVDCGRGKLPQGCKSATFPY